MYLRLSTNLVLQVSFEFQYPCTTLERSILSGLGGITPLQRVFVASYAVDRVCLYI